MADKKEGRSKAPGVRAHTDVWALCSAYSVGLSGTRKHLPAQVPPRHLRLVLRWAKLAQDRLELLGADELQILPDVLSDELFVSSIHVASSPR